MKQIRWRDFSLVSKIIMEVGMIAILLFSMNMLFYARINNSMPAIQSLQSFHRFLRKYRIICIVILR